MLKELANWLAGGTSGPVTELAKLKRGGADIEGFIHADEPLVSPIEEQECVCFFYWARFMSNRAIRFSQSSMRPLRHAMVYAERMFLDLDGGRVLLEPKSRDNFTPEDHAALIQAQIQGFRAKEQLIVDGARVRAHGKLSQTDQGWRMKFDYLTIIGRDRPPTDDEMDEEPPAADI